MGRKKKPTDFVKELNGAEIVEAEKQRPKLGRPTKYHPGLCAQLVELMEKGNNTRCVMAEWGISADTFWRWAREYPDFSDAVSQGQEKLFRLFWKIGFRAMMTPELQFNTNLYGLFMRNCFGWDRKDNLTGFVSLGSTNGVTVKTETIGVEDVIAAVRVLDAFKHGNTD